MLPSSAASAALLPAAELKLPCALLWVQHEQPHTPLSAPSLAPIPSSVRGRAERAARAAGWKHQSWPLAAEVGCQSLTQSAFLLPSESRYDLNPHS